MPKVPKRKIATQDKAPSSNSEILEYSSFLKQQTRVNFHRVNAENSNHLRVIARMPDRCANLKLVLVF